MRKVLWSERARADIRRVDRETAMRIFAALHRFAETGEGDVKKLKGEPGEMRLRVGDYRVRFTEEPNDTLHIHIVRHRSEAYREAYYRRNRFLAMKNTLAGRSPSRRIR